MKDKDWERERERERERGLNNYRKLIIGSKNLKKKKTFFLNCYSKEKEYRFGKKGVCRFKHFY